MLAATTVWLNLGILLSPMEFVDLRSGLLPIWQYSVLMVPAGWSIFIFLRYGERRDRVVAYCSLAATLVWFTSVGFVRS